VDGGKLNPDVAKARVRGVKFDLGHAGGSFTLRLVVPALQQGFVPDSISADLFADTPVTVGINLCNVMSKFLCLGVPLEEVRHPPHSGWLDELGRLKGGRAMGLDVARCAP
jgi:dihydroorotase